MHYVLGTVACKAHECEQGQAMWYPSPGTATGAGVGAGVGAGAAHYVLGTGTSKAQEYEQGRANTTTYQAQQQAQESGRV